MSMGTHSNSSERVLEPFTEQEPFLGTQRKYYGYISGVGAGKTAAGILRTILNMESWNPGEMGAIVAPTTTMIKDVILPEMEKLGVMDNYTYKSQHSDKPGIHAPNGSRALLLSADNTRTVERLKGLNLAWWWIDEEAEVPPRARQILTQRLRVGNYRNGFITTTPKGFNHTYDFFVGDINGEYQTHGEADVLIADDRLSILRVPSFANPHTPEDFKEQLKVDNKGKTYEQEVLGEFTQFEGLVHGWFDPQMHVKSPSWIRDQITREDQGRVRYAGDKAIWGQDWGFSQDPAATICIIIRNKNAYVIDEFKQRGLTNQELAQQVVEMQETHVSGPIYCDPAEPQSIEVFRRHGLDAISADNSVSEGLQAVKSWADNLYINENCVELINELQQYRYKNNPKGENDVLKQNDHLCDALRYCLFGDSIGGDASTSIIGGDVL